MPSPTGDVDDPVYIRNGIKYVVVRRSPRKRKQADILNVKLPETMKRKKSLTVNDEENNDDESEKDANADRDGKIKAAPTPDRLITQQQLSTVTPDHQRPGDQRTMGPDVTINREKVKPPSPSRKSSNYKDHGDNRLYTLQINSIKKLRH